MEVELVCPPSLVQRFDKASEKGKTKEDAVSSSNNATGGLGC